MRVARDDFVQSVYLAFKRRSKTLKHMSSRWKTVIELTEEHGASTVTIRVHQGRIALSLICESPRTLTFEVYSTTRRRMWKTFYKFRCERAWPNPKLIQQTFEAALEIGNRYGFPREVEEVYAAQDIAQLDRMWGRLCARSIVSRVPEESSTT